MIVLVTGGAGFIGSTVIRRLVAAGHTVVNVDLLTYAADLTSLAHLEGQPSYAFERSDICDAEAMREIFARHRPEAVLHLAAESHVDRSIDGPAAFVHTNVVGTFTLLEAARAHWSGLEGAARERFRFVNVSTDEVFGSLEPEAWFTAASPYEPSSPYSATKASADHLTRAWRTTFGLPTVVTNCSNNFGPWQFPEKLIPLVTMNAIDGKRLPVYGRGENVRDWLFVEDHAEALVDVLTRGRAGSTYLVGARNPRRNIDVVRAICTLVDELAPSQAIGPRASLIEFVVDRPGHDFRYAIDPSEIERELEWRPRHPFEEALRRTVAWYLENRAWCERVGGASGRARRGLSGGAAS
ncbi:MAG: dTDP-glucose 4,6-dehydratase [Labilithrix sp.]|nr:dTDP-glucose 4,6-dehydratase [Labilithrix sp.]